MEESMKFNSQVCTTKEQSQHLLDLGLKPETADMGLVAKIYWGDHWKIQEEEREYRYCVGYEDTKHFYNNRNDVEVMPAWSLHRLIELLPQSINLTNYADTHYYLVIKPSRVLYMNDFKEWLYYNDDTNYYNRLIDCIRWTIEQKLFNKEYLKQ